jgi:putative ABC transport system permease protein
VVFGVAPALMASRVDLTRRFAEQSRRQSGAHRRFGGLLSASEIAVAVVLLTAAMLFIRTFANLGAVEPGFDPHGLLAVQVTTDAHNITTSREARTIQDARELIRATPGVIDATASMSVPFDTDSLASLRYVIEGRPLDGPYHGIGNWRPVAARYFETLRIPLLRGRTFTDRDSFNAPPVVIINQAMADKWWPHGDAIGQRVVLGRGTGWDEPPRGIVGIVANLRDESLDQEPAPSNYVPIAQLPDRVAASALGQLTWIVRTQSPSEPLGRRIVQLVQHAHGGMPTQSLGEVTAIMERSKSHAGFRTWLMASFAAIAVLLAAIGVYGVIAYAVRQRTREIGIRMAIGADPRGIVRLVVFSSLRYSLAGLVVGVVCAAVAARALKAFLFGITSHDPMAFALASVVLGCVAAAAAWVPARRAADIDPIVALRAE